MPRDLFNILRYGPHAPRFQERIWVNPADVREFIPREEIKRVTGMNRSDSSGLVIDWDQVRDVRPVAEDFRMAYCFGHWRDGKSWEELGVYDYMLQTKKYGHLTLDDMATRYAELDRTFQEIRQEGRLKTRDEINSGNFREQDGILIHIGDDGTPFFGGLGYHRLAIAKILEFDSIPACIGVVGNKALDRLPGLRAAGSGAFGKRP